MFSKCLKKKNLADFDQVLTRKTNARVKCVPWKPSASNTKHTLMGSRIYVCVVSDFFAFGTQVLLHKCDYCHVIQTITLMERNKIERRPVTWKHRTRKEEYSVDDVFETHFNTNKKPSLNAIHVLLEVFLQMARCFSSEQGHCTKVNQAHQVPDEIIFETSG